MEEIWKPVVGFETFYEVSNLGKCRSLPRTINYSDGRVGKWKGKTLKPIKKEDGYIRYHLTIENKLTRYSAHRMVAKAFIPNPDNKRCVNHKDAVRDNNIVTNLEWSTDAENVKYSYDYGNRDKKFYGVCCVKKEINMKKLISLKDFVLQYSPTREQIENYAKFLDQPLQLGFFVACDEEGNVLEEPSYYNGYINGDRGVQMLVTNTNKIEVIKQYQQAKDRVLFEGFSYVNTGVLDYKMKGESFHYELDIEKWFNGWTVERYIDYIKRNVGEAKFLYTTPTAQKQIGL